MLLHNDRKRILSLMLRARPLSYRLLAKAKNAPSGLISASKEQIELAPGAQVQSFDAIALPGEEFRATGTLSMSESSLQHERMGARRCTGINGATVAYRLEDVFIADSSCYAGGKFDNLRSQKRRVFVSEAIERIEEAQLCTDTGAEQFFGHWLCDAMCTELLASDRQLPGISIAGANRPHEAGYRELLGLPGHAVSVAHVKRLWVIDDKGYNPHRIQRLLRLRRTLRAGVASSGEKLVFLDRGTIGTARNLVNRSAVVDHLAKRGFAVIQPERMTVRALTQALCDARLVVGVEGSQLNHALLALPEGAGLLTIQPPDRFNMFNKYIAEFASLKFGFVVADALPGGFSLDTERLDRTIALFDKHL